MSTSSLSTDWKPIGIESLEKAALEVVKSVTDTIVIAGPGAGKTELLAQRACYLLQMRICPSPKKILAISFKRDAARNLADRVTARCGNDLAYRLHSLTFDAFAKGIVDRFRQALPLPFRVTHDYELIFNLNKGTANNWIRDELPFEGSTLSEADRRSIQAQMMYDKIFIGQKLSTDDWSNKPAIERAAAELWHYLLYGGKKSLLNFHMLGSLAELILRSNPLILTALRSTYAFVFLDEFQDTSKLHYQLTKTAFQGSKAILTAVGDNKQRVNKWAGAMDGIFDQYIEDYGAQKVHLLMNYRSAPELVRIQQVIASAIDETAPPTKAFKRTGTSDSRGECLSLVFQDYKIEASRIANLIAKWMQRENIKPRDICVLCRQRPADYSATLQAELELLTIPSRIEHELQDLLSEPITSLIVDVLRLTSGIKVPNSWTASIDLLCQIHGISELQKEHSLSSRFVTFINSLKKQANQLQSHPELLETLVTRVINFFGPAELKALYPQYNQGDFFEEQISAIVKELSARVSSMPLIEALDDFEGLKSIPIMTMHKSKGLEYHTVVFIGLEDAALWNFRNEPDEELCGLFVALSRAKMRAVFTFSKLRPDKYDQVRRQSRSGIKRLYDVLAEAGITPEETQ